MAKIKITCPHCQRMLQCEERAGGKKVKCPHCKKHLPVPGISRPINAPLKPNQRRRRVGKKTVLVCGSGWLFLLLTLLAGWWLVPPVSLRWPDRRPVGILFLASHYHSSATNPRGWFNDPGLDFTGPGGGQRFRQALMDYTDRSLAILKRTGAQGVIVWDLEGEQFPHKTSFIGEPRQLQRLAPEMAAAADEFFARLRGAGLKIGLTVRPQELVFADTGVPYQSFAFNLRRVLLEKMDYARSRWGATIFYVDSNGGVFRPDELWQLRRLAAARPDFLLIPEHTWLPYRTGCAPYAAVRKGKPSMTERWANKLFPGSFQALDISDAAGNWAEITVARSRGDLLLFRAWCWGPECALLEGLAHDRP